ncbi:hypothetical protein CC1G_02755 [Coprinopsis cinerea okayama7|uniref:C2H2-type domain-containing protein n=1 Tax=Coprinopsis cinerea (strain Okayama-7 / 130 / ATCC MYA-4618 / FGSC 9003) TaxID=240176 RepID=A8MZV1_COPC7|nr:hypothetical protein CC1G_02755 [Coprinopsis cinerea okayama7\|eukprot:XP_001828174.2 hypothetical protein CC1G_02755 [Coprinopsis cinerea okayama7\
MARNRKTSAIKKLPCPFPRCKERFKTDYGRTNHVRAKHASLAGHQMPAAPSPAASRRSCSPVSSEGGLSPNGWDNHGHEHIPQSSPSPPPPQAPRPKLKRKRIPFLQGIPCSINGDPLPSDTPPPPRYTPDSTDWTPFDGELQFNLTDFLYRRVEMSQANINTLLEMWALSLMQHGSTGPFDSYQHIYDTIDMINDGNAPWKCFKANVNEDLGDDAPAWKNQEYEVWYRDPDTVLTNLLDNPDFDGEFDTAAYVEFDEKGQRRWSDFMSANFAWKQSEKIYRDNPATEGAMYVPLILGSDKTTVSVATGNIEYHPLYLSIGNIHNSVRRAHRHAVVPIAFLAIPKSDRKYDNDPDFRRFKRQLYHSSISAIFQSIKDAMTTPVIRRCPDGHYRRVIYDFGSFIADYPEQVMLAGICQGWCPRCTVLPANMEGVGGPRTNELIDAILENGFSHQEIWDNYGFDSTVVPFTRDFPRACIYEILTSDLLHQVIKGTFKDHLVTWVEDYLYLAHEKAEADAIMDEIDRRLAAVPSFSGLRRFKQGRRFKQWTGDDSKALMKIYLPAINGLVPSDIVKCISAFMDFCFLVRRNDFDPQALAKIQESLAAFHKHREFFRKAGVRADGFSLPRQHSLVHYRDHIINFGAPNGLCSSITESRHITAVKRPWRRSSRFEALGQMLLTNQRLDKLAAIRASFIAREMIPPDRLPPQPTITKATNTDWEDDDLDEPDEGVVDGEDVLADVNLGRTREGRFFSADEVAAELDLPAFPQLLRNFLHDLTHPQDSNDSDDQSDWEDNDILDSIPSITTFRSAIATFYAPSDISGIRGMKREWIRCTESWRNSGPRHDTVFVVQNEEKPGFRGLAVVRVKKFISFTFEGTTYPCAVVEWFKKVGRAPDKDTGLWVVEPDSSINGRDRDVTIIHIDSILRSAHLIPRFGPEPIMSTGFKHIWTLDAFNSYFIRNTLEQGPSKYMTTTPESSPIHVPPRRCHLDPSNPVTPTKPPSIFDPDGPTPEPIKFPPLRCKHQVMRSNEQDMPRIKRDFEEAVNAEIVPSSDTEEESQPAVYQAKPSKIPRLSDLEQDARDLQEDIKEKINALTDVKCQQTKSEIALLQAKLILVRSQMSLLNNWVSLLEDTLKENRIPFPPYPLPKT